jgi:adenosylmethionine---8-amino-7-oxononanoate aminotransferase
LGNNQQTAQQLLNAVKAYDLPLKNIRQRGMITAFEVASSNAQFASDCYAAALRHGLLLRPIGNTVYWMPPYCLNAAEIDHLVQATKATILETMACS